MMSIFEALRSRHDDDKITICSAPGVKQTSVNFVFFAAIGRVRQKVNAKNQTKKQCEIRPTDMCFKINYCKFVAGSSSKYCENLLKFDEIIPKAYIIIVVYFFHSLCLHDKLRV